MAPSRLQLKRNEDRRLRAGHLWVFSNEVDADATPLAGFEPGETVNVIGQNGRELGSAYINPHSLICARLFSRRPDRELDKSLIKHRLNIAAGLRRQYFGSGACRLVFGEADGLPGLLVDRLDRVLVLQCTTLGTERRLEPILEALGEVFAPEGILLRNDHPVREREGLEPRIEVVVGQVPEVVAVDEGPLRLELDPRDGAAMGRFLDQAVNRGRLLPWLRPGARVLELDCGEGAWGLRAAAHCEGEAVCAATDPRRLHRVEENVRSNGLSVATRAGEALEVLKALRRENEKFDAVICNPPVLVPRKRDWNRGRRAYRQLNQAALQVTARDGLLVSSSRSGLMTERELLRTVQAAGRHRDRALQLLETGHQSPDHPVHPAIPETAYLKALFLRVLHSW